MCDLNQISTFNKFNHKNTICSYLFVRPLSSLVIVILRLSCPPMKLQEGEPGSHLTASIFMCLRMIAKLGEAKLIFSTYNVGI